MEMEERGGDDRPTDMGEHHEGEHHGFDSAGLEQKIHVVTESVVNLQELLEPTEDVEKRKTEKFEVSKWTTLIGVLFYMTLIAVDFVLAMLYMNERAILYYNLTANVTVGGPYPPNDHWYDSGRPEWLRWTLFGLGVYRCIPFATQTLSSFGAKLFTVYGVVDLISLVPLLILASPIPVLSNLWVPYYLRCWGIVKECELMITFIAVQNGLLDTGLGKQIFVMFIRIISVIFTALNTFEWTETSFSGALDSFDSFYFSVVTLSTVGYGDILPHNVYSKVVTMILIVCIFTVVPTQVGALLEAIGIQRANGGSFLPKNIFGPKKHVIVCGSSLDEVNIADILSYFQPQKSRTPRFSNEGIIYVVFLLQKEASPVVKKLLESNKYKKHVKYLVGSGTNADDLKRAGIDTADAVFILADYYDDGISIADERNAFRVWTIHDSFPHTPVYIYSLKEASTVQFKDYPKLTPEKKHKHKHTLHLKKKAHQTQQMGASTLELEIIHHGKPQNFAKVNISNQNLKMAMMGYNTLYRGSIPFIANLFKLSEPIDGIKEKWLNTYSDGSGNEIYQDKIPTRFIGKHFHSAVLELFVEYEVIFFAIKSIVDGEGVIFLNPGSEYTIKEKDEGFYIAQDDSDIQRAFQGGPNRFETKATTMSAGVEALKKKEPADVLQLIHHPKHSTIRFKDMELYNNWEERTGVRPFPWAPKNSTLPLCQLLKDPSSFESMVVEPGTEFHNHIIVIANGIKPEGLLPFCVSLRSPYVHKNDIPEILIVTSDDLSIDQVDDLLLIPHLYFMTTRINKERDLAQTRILQAREIVIFSDPSNWQGGDDTIMVDRSAISLINKVRSIRGDAIKITVELIFRSNWKFIPPKPTSDDFENPTGIHYLFTPAYVCGNIFSPNLIEGILFQSYLNRPDLPGLVSLMLGLKSPNTYLREKTLGMQCAYVLQIHAKYFVTDEQGVFWGSVFQYLLQKGIIGLGIYKMPGGDNGYGYTYTNPIWQTKVYPEDRLYVVMGVDFQCEKIEPDLGDEEEDED